ncbi:hypothetical protein QQ054_31885 [Oscillatoria amoena NRMC-F 0135]|nr:hypothetical protein [Oscillatoria laete-virens]MDL5050604.1 hypothetical protein [Oscillatoria amoena NRMC-F 0135]MDL5055618.1 hypothetical protein [Oscillatoria laete-virens NRMC-F 0139]
MKVIYYLFVLFFGFFGVGLVLRGVEVILTGERSSSNPFIGLGMGIVFLILAIRFLGKAREN